MSFEGKYQLLCDKGHYHFCDVYEFDEEYWKCPDCDSRARWRNLLDYTNGSVDEDGNDISGLVNMTKYLIKRGKVCPHCDSKISSDTYLIPADEGVDLG